VKTDCTKFGFKGRIKSSDLKTEKIVICLLLFGDLKCGMLTNCGSCGTAGEQDAVEFNRRAD